MKKLLLLSLCTVLTFSSLQAQNETEEKKFHLGFVALPKLTWATAETKNIEGNGVKAGLSLGISGDYFFAKNYALSVDILHSIGGYNVKADSISRLSTKYGNVSIAYQESSFQLPISLKLRTNEIGYWRYFAQFGIAPTFSYRPIKATYDPTDMFQIADDGIDKLVNDSDDDFDYENVQGQTIDPVNLRYFLEEDNVTKVRIPMLVGIGAEWNLSGNTSIIMGLRYQYGLVNVMKAENTRAQVSSLGLHAGVRF